MPSTIIRRPGAYESPVETSASVGEDGFVTAEALFLKSSGYEINTRINRSLFPALSNINLQEDMVVASRSIEKRNGLWFLRVRAVGALNPPIFSVTRSASPRSFDKSQTIVTFVGDPPEAQNETITFEFDYLAETVTVATVYAGDRRPIIKERSPQLLSVWNKRGQGKIVVPENTTNAPPDLGTGLFGEKLVLANYKILTSSTFQTISNITRMETSFQLIFE